MYNDEKKLNAFLSGIYLYVKKNVIITIQENLKPESVNYSVLQEGRRKVQLRGLFEL